MQDGARVREEPPRGLRWRGQIALPRRLRWRGQIAMCAPILKFICWV